jgi:hypothetical protein
MTVTIGRRNFLATLGAAAAWPPAARAQQADRVRRIGVIMNYAENDPEGQVRLSALRDALRKFGWAEGSAKSARPPRQPLVHWPYAPYSRQPSEGRMTQNITPLFGPTCLGAQT